MSKELQQAGIFRGRIVSYGLNKAESGAKSVFVTVEIDEIFQNDEWYDWKDYQLHVSGDMWVVKKDGTLNERQNRTLMDVAGWDGSFVSIAEGVWNPPPVQVVVEEDEYKDKVRYRIAFLNQYDRMPGGGNVSAEDARAMEKRYGTQLRALAGNAARQSAAPEGAPAKPKPAPGRAPTRRQADTEYSEPESNAPPAPVPPKKDDLPF